jgi:ATP adenylyltransferase
MDINSNLFVPSKVKYVRGEKPDVECILCGVIDRNQKVESLEIFRTKLFCICANLFPYSPGHLLVFPKRHYTDIREMNEDEALELFRIQNLLVDILDELYTPSGYNIGYNLGPCGGNSIKHLHLHIVPRFKNELGFLDIIGNSRIIVDDPQESISRISSLCEERMSQLSEKS